MFVSTSVACAAACAAAACAATGAASGADVANGVAWVAACAACAATSAAACLRVSEVVAMYIGNSWVCSGGGHVSDVHCPLPVVIVVDSYFFILLFHVAAGNACITCPALMFLSSRSSGYNCPVHNS